MVYTFEVFVDPFRCRKNSIHKTIIMARVVQPIFGAWDYVVLVLVLLISSGIGVYYRFSGGKQKTVKVRIIKIEYKLFKISGKPSNSVKKF